jgi:hypothetical protein
LTKGKIQNLPGENFEFEFDFTIKFKTSEGIGWMMERIEPTTCNKTQAQVAGPRM